MYNDVIVGCMAVMTTLAESGMDSICAVVIHHCSCSDDTNVMHEVKPLGVTPLLLG